MNTSFKGDELVLTLTKADREVLRKARNLTRELGRYSEFGLAATGSLSKILESVNGEGVFAATPVQPGNTDVVEGAKVIADTKAADTETAAASGASGAGGRKGGAR